VWVEFGRGMMFKQVSILGCILGFGIKRAQYISPDLTLSDTNELTASLRRSTWESTIPG
jgi:hypothetical protein